MSAMEDNDVNVAKQEQVPPNDLLLQHLESIKSNAPQNKEEFYQQSFQIFSTLNRCVKGNDATSYKDAKKSEISDIVSQYVDLVHEFPETNRVPIWDMANLLYFSDVPWSTSLNDWINEHVAIPDDKNEFEIAVHQILRGNAIEAIDQLNAIADLTEAQLATIKIITDLLDQFQHLQGDQTTYAAQWSLWHELCATELCNFINMCEEVGDSNVDQEIRVIFDVLCGDEDTIFYSGTYYEKVMGTLLYSRPATTLSGLTHLAQRLVDEDTQVEPSAYILMGCFDEAFETCHDLWLQTHLGHALIVLGAKQTDKTLLSVETETIIDPVYYSIREYATKFAEKNMWKEAVVYLSACVENREIWIKQLLGELPLKNKELSLLMGILHIAEEHNMIAVQRYIHQAMGQRYEEKKETRQATIEYGKAQDLKALDRFAHAEFSQYLRTGKLGDVVTDMEALKSSPHYAMLIVYHNFRVYIEKKDWKKAAEALLELLKDEHLPTKFEIVLLVDNFVILQDPRDFYTEEELLHLIKIFRVVTKDNVHHDFFAKYYQFIHHHDVQGSVVVARMRELLGYRAATVAMESKDLITTTEEVHA
ncbi:Nup85 nucleoporin-domain-containing protein [Mucor mucedo]|uniref:Nup85 nucleoporin-domain-containing protein n=1 Tax=Mucor mucedo TaxID=29922 RepID=UPI00221F8470|nr:Nup85 nucleoporin-domain-containing protein [Mucor mucedo]KAI7865207.1 Nup85 nucleoporin-domain-containing protein [Mucor mucedo]